MTFSEVNKDIIVFPGNGGCSFIASGNITKGQGVTFAGDNSVKVPNDTSSRLLGIANANVTHGNVICIYYPGNVVYCKLSGSQSAGTKVGVISEGYLSDLADYAPSDQAIVVKGVTSTGNGIVLIL